MAAALSAPVAGAQVGSQETPSPPAQVAEAAVVETITVWGERDAANPYADPSAPFKVDRSASSKFTEDLVNTPKTVTVVPKEVIEALGATSFKEVMRSQPGITLGTGEGGNAFGDRIFIRGFEARNDVYIDGMRDPGVVSRETFAVEQIEIVKGPGSTFAGRGSTGGAVSLVTKAPASKNFTTGEITVGSADLRRLETDVNRNLGNGVKVRLNGMWTESGTPGRDAVEQERWGVAGAVSYELPNGATMAADYYHLDADSIPDWGLPWDTRAQKPFTGAGRDAFYGFVGRDFQETGADVGTLKVEVPLSDGLSLRNQTRYGDTENRYVASAPERPNLSAADPDLWTMVSNPKNRNGRNRYLINQTDASLNFLTGEIGHELVAGAEYSWEKVGNRPFALLDSEAGTPLGATAGITQPLLNPNPYLPLNSVARPGADFSKATVETRAVYVLDTVTLSPEWQLSGGLRYDDFTLDYDSFGVRTGTTSLRSDDGVLNWHGGVVYKPVEQGTLYLAVASSSNPSGEQLDGAGVSYGGLAAATANLDPERNRSYEVGMKWNLFDEHLSATAALFRIDKTNARVNDPAVAGAVTLAGKQRVEGVEFGLAGNITRGWSVFGGLTLLDTEIRESTNPAEVGGKFPNIADTSFSLMTVYQLLDGLSVGGNAYYSSAKGIGNAVAGTAEVPGYWRFDLVGAYEVNESVSLRLNLLNLTDRDYYDAVYRSGAPFAYIAPGRSFQLSARISL
ncbi:MAG TPA: TonB-dependent siderophore receptor [Azospirillaceae bacterium]|nr:TonB-dependent siderophore receptor [Azospirillaceae bacterium]